MRLARALDVGASVATLQAWCPAASRRAIARWLTAARRTERQRLCRLRWRHVGRVWALDWSVPPQPIDGVYRGIVHVRDLASQYHLAALPVRRVTATVVCDLLRALCVLAAAPLVLKLDNGAACRSRALQAWAAGVGTVLLYSPPRWPRYNGAIEASIGAISTRTHHAAADAGHPGEWSTDDVEAARVEANTTARRRQGQTRSALGWWRTATPITVTERRRFARAYQAQRRPHASLPTTLQERLAIVRTLDVLGYVSITRRADLVHQFPARKRQRLGA